MKHDRFEELLLLSLYDELDRNQQEELARHLAGCEVCRTELAELRQFHSMMDKRRPVLPETLLQEARSQLRGAILSETYHEKARSTTWQAFSGWVTAHRAPLAAAASLALGIGIGYLLFTGRSAPPTDLLLPPDLLMANVQVVDADPADGIIQVSFDAVRPMELQGNMGDERIRKVLSEALLRSRNPAVRLRAVNAIEEQPVQTLDPEIQHALVAALKFDRNVGVRKRALAVIQQQPLDSLVREGLLYVLMNDENPGMRVAAINALESTGGTASEIRPELREALRQRIENEENDYVRLRSKAFLREVRYQ